MVSTEILSKRTSMKLDPVLLIRMSIPCLTTGAPIEPVAGIRR